MPRMYRVVVSDTLEIEPGYARHIKQALNDLGLHVRVRRVHQYERLSSDRPGSIKDVMRDVQAHPGCTIRELALSLYPNDARAGEVSRARAEMNVRSLANKLVRAGRLRKEFDHGLRLYPLTRAEKTASFPGRKRAGLVNAQDSARPSFPSANSADPPVH
jgi:hypothetical protein